MSIDVQFLDSAVGSKIVTIREDGNTTQNWSFESGAVVNHFQMLPVINIGEFKWTQNNMKFSGAVQDGVRWDAIETIDLGWLGNESSTQVWGLLKGELTFPIDSFLPRASDGNYGTYLISALLLGKAIHADKPFGDYFSFGDSMNCPARFRRRVRLQVGCGFRNEESPIWSNFNAPPEAYEFLKNYTFDEIYDCTEVERKELEEVRASAINGDYQPQRCLNVGNAKFGVFIEVIAKAFIFEELVLQISKI
jgi:hypothetical protein